ncbi:MAG: FAD-dependent oxidoreductase [Magnetococcales bacterium]|nr:FAD-dependent oxidoreductase [Magnetococcales bacterium]
MSNVTRRNFIKLTGGVAAVGLASGLVPVRARAQATPHRVVIIGGGYGGTIAAKYLRMADPTISVTLIERDHNYHSCPLSNPVIVGLRDLKVQKWGYDGLKKHGINVVHDTVTEIDAAKSTIKTAGSLSFSYDKCIVSPGIDFKWGAIPGYDESAAKELPHAWHAGPQTLQLKSMVESMEDGEPFIIVAPPNPFRCPPGPYERASLIAWYLQRHKPKSKVIILDPKDDFSKMPLFQEGWKKMNYALEWVAGGQGGKVTRVDPAKKTVTTDMEEYKSSAINVIPPQQAGKIAAIAGLTNEAGWCPVNVKTFESEKHKNIYVIGDACIAPDMPKSGYSANSQAKIAAACVVASLQGKPEPDPSYVNTCYSLIAPDYGISVAVVWKFADGKITKVSGGTSAKDASAAVRKQEALYAEGWYQAIMSEMFG